MGASRGSSRLIVMLAVLSSGALGCRAPDANEVGAGRPGASRTLEAAVLRARQTAPGYEFVADAAGILRSQAGDASVVATPRGVRLARTGFAIEIETASVGRDDLRGARGVVGQHAEGQELVLEREGDVDERFLTGPIGVEQSFLVRTRPAGHGPLTIEVGFEGLAPDTIPGESDRVLLRDGGGFVRAGYRDLAVTDAEGRRLAARMDVRGSVVALMIDDTAATYPVLVDPTVWTQQTELVADDGAPYDLFGASVALSGGVAIIGAPACSTGSDGIGAAYVFVQSGTAWVQQAKLSAGDGATCDQFGQSVALSGGTAIVGALGVNAAYVFVQSGTTWTQQARLSASGENSFGWSVAVSGDNAVVGTYDGTAVYAFARQGTTWAQQAKLLPSDDSNGNVGFGWSVGVSGGTAIVGAYDASVGAVLYQGAAYVFAQSGATWAQQAKLTASDGKSGDNFGYSVAVSGDTAIVGADKPVSGSGEPGAAYVYVQSGTTWAQQAELTASNGTPSDLFGNFVALSGDTAVVGGFDAKAPAQAAYVFARGGTRWTQQTELTANTAGSGNFGTALAISGRIVLAGDSSYPVNGDLFQGDAYVFVATPPAPNGAFCATNPDCVSAFCVDGVCCDGSCGGGVATDCQSCLRALTGAADGTCATVLAAAAHPCRPGKGPCDAAGICDGTGTTCPADGPPPPEGAACDDGDACVTSGRCIGGVCTGTPVTCAAEDDCHDPGVCANPGGCSSPPKPDGTRCSEGECHAGSCSGRTSASSSGASGAGGAGGAGSSNGGGAGTPIVLRSCSYRGAGELDDASRVAWLSVLALVLACSRRRASCRAVAALRAPWG